MLLLQALMALPFAVVFLYTGLALVCALAWMAWGSVQPRLFPKLAPLPFRWVLVVPAVVVAVAVGLFLAFADLSMT